MLTKEQIQQYLAEMDIELASRGLTGEIVLCGGAVMALVYEVRQSTKDIDDAVFLIRRLGITNEGELLDMMERNISKQMLTPMAGFFAKEMLKRALNQTG